MAETVKTKYSPLHIKCEVGYPYGVADSSYQCGFHTGCDFPQSGTNAKNPDLYGCVDDGTVVYVYKNSQGSIIGKMGATGKVTGVHLHLELSKTQAWNCNNFLNPVEPLGIPNIRGTIVEYDGSVTPEPPTPEPPTPMFRNLNNWKKWFMSLKGGMRI